MKEKIALYFLLIVIIFLSLMLCYTNLKAHGVETKLTERLFAVQTELLGSELIEQENVSLRKYIKEHDEPIILPKTEIKEIIRVEYKPVEITKTETIEASIEPFTYIYKWDGGLPIAEYDWNGKHNFVTPQIDFSLIIEKGDVGNIVKLKAISQLEPGISYEVIPSNATDFIIKDNKETIHVCKWCWGAGGVIIGGLTVVGAVELAKGL